MAVVGPAGPAGGRPCSALTSPARLAIASECAAPQQAAHSPVYVAHERHNLCAEDDANGSMRSWVPAGRESLNKGFACFSRSGGNVACRQIRRLAFLRVSYQERRVVAACRVEEEQERKRVERSIARGPSGRELDAHFSFSADPLPSRSDALVSKQRQPRPG